MQVNQVSDHVTHAVIGGQKARDFGISQSAEFFNILSNTLYSDKIMAVVREVLCNAWDIHIQTGRTDTAIAIILTETEFSIRDFGTGISDDDMVPVYCVYGNSTKKLDGLQTGGFGLGCKAPFAYVDHFEVISYHAGRKTTYAVSKSSAEVAGKPSLMPIVSVPTEESGLLVNMKIKNREDYVRFRDVIRTIVRFGQMNATMNGDAMDTIAFTEAKHGFMILPKSSMTGVTGAQNNQLFCRYGNVVYPIPEAQEYNDEHKRVGHLLGLLGDRYDRNAKSIIFQAKPNTIAVTPSRESLSMTEHTIQALRELMQAFLAMTADQLKSECIRLEQNQIAQMWVSGRPADLLTSDNKIPTLFNTTGDYFNTGRGIVAGKLPERIVDIPTISQTYMAQSYPDFAGFRAKDVDMRLEALIVSGFGNKGKIQSFRQEYKLRGNIVSDWFQRRIVSPLVTRMGKHPELDPNKLFAYGKHQPKAKKGASERERNRYAYRYAEVQFAKAIDFSPRNLEEYLPFLRNFIVLAYNRQDIEDRLSAFPIIKNWLGKTQDYLAYIVPRAGDRAQVAREFFATQGLTVIDLTRAHAWEPKEVIEPIGKITPVKPRKKGLPKLSSTLDQNGRVLSQDKAKNEDAPRTEKPEAVMQFFTDGGGTKMVLQHTSNELAINVAKVYGDRIGVCTNVNQLTKFVSQGISNLEPWLLEQLLMEMQTNPRIVQGLALTTRNMKRELMDELQSYGNAPKLKLLKAAGLHPELGKHFGVVNTMTRTDRQIVSMVDEMISSYRWKTLEGKAKELADILKGIKTDTTFELLARKVRDADLTVINIDGLLGLYSIQYNTSGDIPKPTPKVAKQRSMAIDLLTYALEG